MADDQRFERSGRQVALVVLITMSVLLAGCSSFQPTGGSTPTPPSASKAATQHEEVDGVEMTINVTRQHEGNRSWTVQEIATRPQTREFRNIVRSTGPPSADERGSLAPGSRVVSNGSVRYLYPADSDRVFRSDVSDVSRNRSEQIRRLVAAVNDDTNDPIRHPDLGLSPLPIVPAGSGSATSENDSTRWRDEMVTVQYRGTETVAGRNTYVLDLQPVGENASLLDATLWLDTEYLYPIKRHTVIVSHGERYEFTSIPQNVTFNPDFSPGTFSVESGSISENVSVVETESYDSYSEMAADIDRPLPEPDVPPGFEFESGFRSDGERSQVSVTYTKRRGESIRVSVFGESGRLTGGQREVIRGQRVVLRTYEGQRHLVWNDDERQYSVSGTVTNQTLRHVAASIIDG